MKGLMLAIEEKIKGLTDRQSDTFLSPDLDIIPEGVKFPAQGIKDGAVQRHNLPGGAIELSLPIEIGIYVKLTKQSKAVVEILEQAALIHGQLKEDSLSGYVKNVDPLNESTIQVMVKKGDLILRKILYYQYEREE